MPYRESFTETELTKSALAEYSIASNSVVAFLEEILPRCTYNLLPCTAYLYEGYKQWLRIYSPSGRSLNRNDFLSEVREYANTSLRDNPNFEWEWTDSTRTQGYIDFSYDPVADEYNIEPFKSIAYWYTHKSILDTDKLSKNYSGLKRRNFALSKGTDTDKEEPQED